MQTSRSASSKTQSYQMFTLTPGVGPNIVLSVSATVTEVMPVFCCCLFCFCFLVSVPRLRPCAGWQCSVRGKTGKSRIPVGRQIVKCSTPGLT